MELATASLACILYFSPGNSYGMLGEYNQKVNNKENKLLAETIIWIILDKQLNIKYYHLQWRN